MYERNALAKGELEIDGVALDLHAVENDVYAVASIEDHIAPWRSVYKITQMLGGDTRFRLGHSGHIAGIINAPGSGKGNYWSADATPADPDAWFAAAHKHAGSWWPDWLAWLVERAGERVLAPTALGSERYAPLGPAPGTYVLEKS
jgi:polyhydroxyalkanoate synthase